LTSHIPRYVSKDESDRRGVKSGWYTVEERGALLSGPFASLQACEDEIGRRTRASLKESSSRQVRKEPLDAPSSWHAKRVQAAPAPKLTKAGPFWIIE
jgi:hypothetical protein